MGYLFLLLTILLESGAVILIKLSEGFTHKGYAAMGIAAYGISFVCLGLCLKHLPAGLANAIWAGSSTIIVALLGILIFKEELTALQYVFLLMIVAGIVGLNLSGK